ncbi:hypothetical protein HDU76_005603 [Blyttiomyces sp. JEL0837]|nr:hypothetical protein HDU76_005603 [Blyttiomyces sp. JEL0837]
MDADGDGLGLGIGGSIGTGLDIPDLSSIMSPLPSASSSTTSGRTIRNGGGRPSSNALSSSLATATTSQQAPLTNASLDNLFESLLNTTTSQQHSRVNMHQQQQQHQQLRHHHHHHHQDPLIPYGRPQPHSHSSMPGSQRSSIRPVRPHPHPHPHPQQTQQQINQRRLLLQQQQHYNQAYRQATQHPSSSQRPHTQHLHQHQHQHQRPPLSQASIAAALADPNSPLLAQLLTALGAINGIPTLTGFPGGALNIGGGTSTTGHGTAAGRHGSVTTSPVATTPTAATSSNNLGMHGSTVTTSSARGLAGSSSSRSGGGGAGGGIPASLLAKANTIPPTDFMGLSDFFPSTVAADIFGAATSGRSTPINGNSSSLGGGGGAGMGAGGLVAAGTGSRAGSPTRKSTTTSVGSESGLGAANAGVVGIGGGNVGQKSQLVINTVDDTASTSTTFNKTTQKPSSLSSTIQDAGITSSSTVAVPLVSTPSLVSVSTRGSVDEIQSVENTTKLPNSHVVEEFDDEVDALFNDDEDLLASAEALLAVSGGLSSVDMDTTNNQHSEVAPKNSEITPVVGEGSGKSNDLDMNLGLEVNRNESTTKVGESDMTSDPTSEAEAIAAVETVAVKIATPVAAAASPDVISNELTATEKPSDADEVSVPKPTTLSLSSQSSTDSVILDNMLDLYKSFLQEFHSSALITCRQVVSEHLTKFVAMPQQIGVSSDVYKLFCVIKELGGARKIRSWPDIARKLGFETTKGKISGRLREWADRHHIGTFFDFLLDHPSKLVLLTGEQKEHVPVDADQQKQQSEPPVVSAAEDRDGDVVMVAVVNDTHEDVDSGKETEIDGQLNEEMVVSEATISEARSTNSDTTAAFMMDSHADPRSTVVDTDKPTEVMIDANADPPSTLVATDKPTDVMVDSHVDSRTEEAISTELSQHINGAHAMFIENGASDEGSDGVPPLIVAGNLSPDSTVAHSPLTVSEAAGDQVLANYALTSCLEDKHPPSKQDEVTQPRIEQHQLIEVIDPSLPISRPLEPESRKRKQSVGSPEVDVDVEIRATHSVEDVDAHRELLEMQQSKKLKGLTPSNSLGSSMEVTPIKKRGGEKTTLGSEEETVVLEVAEAMEEVSMILNGEVTFGIDAGNRSSPIGTSWDPEVLVSQMALIEEAADDDNDIMDDRVDGNDGNLLKISTSAVAGTPKRKQKARPLIVTPKNAPGVTLVRSATPKLRKLAKDLEKMRDSVVNNVDDEYLAATNFTAVSTNTDGLGSSPNSFDQFISVKFSVADPNHFVGWKHKGSPDSCDREGSSLMVVETNNQAAEDELRLKVENEHLRARVDQLAGLLRRQRGVVDTLKARESQLSATDATEEGKAWREWHEKLAKLMESMPRP